MLHERVLSRTLVCGVRSSTGANAETAAGFCQQTARPPSSTVLSLQERGISNTLLFAFSSRLCSTTRRSKSRALISFNYGGGDPKEVVIYGLAL